MLNATRRDERSSETPLTLTPDHGLLLDQILACIHLYSL